MRTLEDALRLRQALKTNPHRALVVGASMVGIKLVEVFYEAGMEVCLADLAPQVFPLAASPECAEIITRYLEGKGIKLRLGAGIAGIETAKHGLKAYFSDHEGSEEADLAVIAIGVRPNLQFLDPAQVKIDKGLVVDDHLRTSAPNLYAAGDVAQGTNLLSGEKENIGLWANASYQGRTAGRNMAGVADVYLGSIPHNIIYFMDMVFVGMGDVHRGGRQ
jgi:NADPH-dependent 2,4-dienoyl-CoA reductase/sulfur reductase-like enzyme